MLTEAFVYIMASFSRCIYIGVTRDMPRRWLQHSSDAGSKFVRKYRIHRLVHVERFDRLVDAIQREKQLKGWRRSKKIALIEQSNPEWSDWAIEWGWLAEPGPSLRSGRGEIAHCWQLAFGSGFGLSTVTR